MFKGFDFVNGFESDWKSFVRFVPIPVQELESSGEEERG